MYFNLAEKCAIVFHTSNSVEITTSTLLRQLIFHHEDSVRDPQTLYLLESLESQLSPCVISLGDCTD
jgi:hypothetical protein